MCGQAHQFFSLLSRKMLTRCSEPGPSQSMEAQSGLGVKNDAMVFDVGDPSVVFVAYVVFLFLLLLLEVNEDYDYVDGDGHLNSGCAHIQGLKMPPPSPLPSLGRRS